MQDPRHRLALRAIKTLTAEGFQALLAGGCVRDTLLHRKAKDFDIATNATPEQVTFIFKKASERIVPTGLDHGTVTLISGGHPIEITTFRKDVETDGRHAVVHFEGATLEDDAGRRDFTINALYQDEDGRIYDFHQGQEDLRQQRLRFVGIAEQRIQEDYLRICRLFRFWSRLGFNPDAAALEACKALAPGLKQISQERLTFELLETLKGDFITDALGALVELGILRLINEHLNVAKAQVPLIAAFKCEDSAKLALGRLWLLLAHSQATGAVAQVSQALKLSTLQQRVLQTLSAFDPASLSSKTTAQRMDLTDQCEALLGRGSFLHFYEPVWLAFWKHDPSTSKLLQELRNLEERQSHVRLSPLPITAEELMQQLKLEPGPKLGALLKHLKSAFRNSEWSAKADGLAMARKFVLEKSRPDATSR